MKHLDIKIPLDIDDLAYRVQVLEEFVANINKYVADIKQQLSYAVSPPATAFHPAELTGDQDMD